MRERVKTIAALAAPALAVFATVIVVMATPAQADQDDIPVVLGGPLALLSEGYGAEGSWLTASTTRVDIAGYPVGTYHSWHGRVAADVAVAQLGRRAVYRMGLAMHTVADHRNDIYFRLVRLYYDATQLLEYRLGPGVVYAGLRHRCSHGVDAAVPGRILIRSGPELGHHHETPVGPFRLGVRSFLHGSMIGQNPDTTFRPRLLLASTVQLRLRSGDLEGFASAGLGAALVSGTAAADAGETFGFGSPYRDLKVLPLPAAALGLRAHGRVAAFTLTVHAQRLLDNGLGPRADPETLLAIELGFRW